MQELLESGLLVVVTILSVVLLLMGQKKSSGMTRKQKVMLWRILIATVLLLGLQTLGVEAFDQLGASWPVDPPGRPSDRLSDYRIRHPEKGVQGDLQPADI